MTVAAGTGRSSVWTADGANRNWDFPFKVLSASHVRIEVTDSAGLTSLVGEGFSVAGVNSDDGGTVTYPLSPVAPLPSGYTVQVRRVVPFDQPNRIGNQGGFHAETHERTFDLLAQQVQQVYEEGTARGVTVPFEDGDLPTILPGKADRAGNLLEFNSQGRPVAFRSVEDIVLEGVVADGLLPIATRAGLKAYQGTPGDSLLLTEAGREGVFVLKAGSPPVADAQEGTYVVSNTADFYWERVAAGSVSVGQFGGTPAAANNGPAFVGALAASPAGGQVRIPAGQWTLTTPVPQTTKAAWWLGEYGARLDVPSAGNLFRDRTELADYSGIRDALSFEVGSDDTNHNTYAKYWNWRLEPSGATTSYQKNLLYATVISDDPSSGVGNGGAGVSVNKDAVAADFRSYVAGTNPSGRAFGLNIWAGVLPGGEGMVSGMEIDLLNYGSSPKTLDVHGVDFPKSGMGIVNKGPNHVTSAFNVLSGDAGFYCGFYGEPEALVDDPETRFVKLRGTYAVFRNGHTTVGKHITTPYAPGVELSPAGEVWASTAEGGSFYTYRTGLAANGSTVGRFHGISQNAVGAAKIFGGMTVIAGVATNGSEQTTLAFQGMNGAGVFDTLATLSAQGNWSIKGELQVNNTRVVGARQAAIPNAAAGTEVATINAILAAMRAHGLIAP